MATVTQRGRLQTVAATPPGGEASRTPIASLGDSNFQNRGLTFGKVQHGEDAGMHDAQWVTIKTSASKSDYDIPHTLGHPAGFCHLMNAENRVTTTSTYAASAINRDSWTATTCRVHVERLTGSMDHGELTFLVGGHR